MITEEKATAILRDLGELATRHGVVFYAYEDGMYCCDDREAKPHHAYFTAELLGSELVSIYQHDCVSPREPELHTANTA